MKKIYTTIFSLLTVFLVIAQSPEKMSYQAVIRDASGELITNQSIGMQISIHKYSPSGQVEYSEEHTTNTNSNGLISIEIGSGNVIEGSISDIYWAFGPYYIKTQTDPTGGSNYTISGSSELLSVPHALSSPPFYKTDDNTYYTTGTLGIGISNPWSRLDIMDTLDPATSWYDNVDDFTIYVDAFSVSTDQDKHHTGTYSTINAISGSASGLYGYSHGINSNGENAGVFGEATNAADNYGVLGMSVFQNSNSFNVNNAVGGIAANSDELNVGGAFFAGWEDNEIYTATNFGVMGSALDYTLGDNFGASFDADGSASVNVGILATAPINDYDAAGQFNGDVVVTGTLYETSDKKLKTNIKKMENSMDILRKIEPVEYEYKKSYAEKGLNLPTEHQFGFIAQDLEKIIPNVVSKQKVRLNISDWEPGDEKEYAEFLGVNYKSIIPILTQALKEQDNRILELEQKIIALEKKIK
jgi:hypothetical protein